MVRSFREAEMPHSFDGAVEAILLIVGLGTVALHLLIYLAFSLYVLGTNKKYVASRIMWLFVLAFLFYTLYLLVIHAAHYISGLGPGFAIRIGWIVTICAVVGMHWLLHKAMH